MEIGSLVQIAFGAILALVSGAVLSERDHRRRRAERLAEVRHLAYRQWLDVVAELEALPMSVEDPVADAWFAKFAAASNELQLVGSDAITTTVERFIDSIPREGDVRDAFSDHRREVLALMRQEVAGGRA